MVEAKQVVQMNLVIILISAIIHGLLLGLGTDIIDNLIISVTEQGEVRQITGINFIMWAWSLIIIVAMMVSGILYISEDLLLVIPLSLGSGVAMWYVIQVFGLMLHREVDIQFALIVAQYLVHVDPNPTNSLLILAICIIAFHNVYYLIFDW